MNRITDAGMSKCPFLPIRVLKVVGNKIAEIIFSFNLSKRRNITCKQKDFALGLLDLR